MRKTHFEYFYISTHNENANGDECKYFLAVACKNKPMKGINTLH